LVVVSIIALLVSILLPSLQGAREQAKLVVCGSTQAALGRGLSSYTAENNDWIPGLNTSGVELRALQVKANQEAEYASLQVPDLPVQTYDWITPILRVDMKLPNSRGERFNLIMERYKCAAQLPVKSTVYPTNGAGVKDYEKYFKPLRMETPLSYLMPAYFQFWGNAGKFKALSDYYGAKGSAAKVFATAAPANWEASVYNFEPNVGRLGTPASKVFNADGTRYVWDPTPRVDYDISVWPGLFGSFTSGGAWWTGDTAWGVKAGTTTWDGARVSREPLAKGANLIMSYRHLRRGKRGDGSCWNNKGKISAVFFDGHVQPLSDRESREPELWYPKGTVLKTITEGMTNVPQDYVVR